MTPTQFICVIPGFCKIFKTYEEAWKYTQEYFQNTGHWLCVETM